MSKQDRIDAVTALSQRFAETGGLLVFDYTGLNVARVTALRRQLKEVGAEMLVAKNTLLNIAVQDTPFAALQDNLRGQTAIAFIDGDPALAAKALTKFGKENSETPFTIRAGVLGTDLLSSADIDQLGDLPSREVLLGQFVGMLASPVTGFVSVLADVPRKFLRALSAIAEQKGQ